MVYHQDVTAPDVALNKVPAIKDQVPVNAMSGQL
jgi:hypothetical protein